MPARFLTEATLISKIPLATSSDRIFNALSSKQRISPPNSEINLLLSNSSFFSYPNSIAETSSALNVGLTIRSILPLFLIKSGRALIINLNTDDEK